MLDGKILGYARDNKKKKHVEKFEDTFNIEEEVYKLPVFIRIVKLFLLFPRTIESFILLSLTCSVFSEIKIGDISQREVTS